LILLLKKSTIRWSLSSKITGSNVIGGNYLYGNYWSDYSGEDLDGDGIGDTELPHGPGDLGPLVFNPPQPDVTPPVITMDSSDIPPRTGEVFQVHFTVWDDRSLFGLRVYGTWTQFDVHGSQTSTWNSEDIDLDDDGEFYLQVKIEEDSVRLLFLLNAEDFSRNSDGFAFDLSVNDVILPSLGSIQIENGPFTGEELLVTVDVNDNILVDHVWADYYFNGFAIDISRANGSIKKGSKDRWMLHLPIDPLSSELNYNIVVIDRSGSSKSSGWTSLLVLDNIPPQAVDSSKGYPKTGSTFELSFKISDNRELRSVILITSMTGEKNRIYRGYPPFNGIWTININISNHAQRLEYLLTLLDGSSNSFELRGKMSIADASPPVIERLDNGMPRTSSEFELLFASYDNWDLGPGFFEWWFDNGQRTRFDHIMDRVSIPSIPASVSVLHYRTWVTDSSGNRFQLAEDMEISDGTPPAIGLEFNPPYTSSYWEVHLDLSDNRGLNTSWVEWSFDEGPIQTIALNDQKVWSTKVPERALRVTFEVFCYDISGLDSSAKRELEIGDGTPPMVSMETAPRFVDGSVIFSIRTNDNRGSIIAKLVMRDKSGKEKEWPMEEGPESTYSLSLRTKDLKGTYTYKFIVEDGAGLVNTTAERELGIKVEEDYSALLTLFLVIGCFFLIIIVLILYLKIRFVDDRGPMDGHVEEKKELMVPFEKRPEVGPASVEEHRTKKRNNGT